MAFALPSVAQDAPLQAEIEKLIAPLREFDKQSEAAVDVRRSKYIADLKELEKSIAAKTGDLEQVIPVRNEREAWEKGEATPSIDPKDEAVPLDLRKLRYYFDEDQKKLAANIAKKMAAQRAAVDARLKEMEASLTKEAKIESALAVRNARKNLDTLVSVPTKPTPVAQPNPTSAAPSGAVVTLLPADDLDDFTIYTREHGMGNDPNKVFTLEDGVLRASGTEPGFLITKQSFTNYHLELEYQWGTDAGNRDSGVFVNSVEKNDGEFTSLECNLLGPDSKFFSGQVYLFGKGPKQLRVDGTDIKSGPIATELSKSAEKAVGEWNKMEVICDQGRFLVRINGQATVSGNFPKPRLGTILLQSGRGEIKFRNMNVIDYDAWIADVGPLAKAGKYKNAIQVMESLFEADSNSFEPLRGLWLANLYAADENGGAHESLCQRIFTELPERRWSSDGSRSAKAYVVMPGASDQKLLREAMSAARYGVETAVPKSGGMFIWYSLTMGMVEFRAKNHAEALRWLEKPMKNKTLVQSAPSLAFAAMANHAKGNEELARQLLSQAEAAFGQIDQPNSDWSQIVNARVAIKEAKELIK